MVDTYFGYDEGEHPLDQLAKLSKGSVGLFGSTPVATDIETGQPLADGGTKTTATGVSWVGNKYVVPLTTTINKVQHIPAVTKSYPAVWRQNPLMPDSQMVSPAHIDTISKAQDIPFKLGGNYAPGLDTIPHTETQTVIDPETGKEKSYSRDNPFLFTHPAWMDNPQTTTEDDSKSLVEQMQRADQWSKDNPDQEPLHSVIGIPDMTATAQPQSQPKFLGKLNPPVKVLGRAAAPQPGNYIPTNIPSTGDVLGWQATQGLVHQPEPADKNSPEHADWAAHEKYLSTRFPEPTYQDPSNPTPPEKAAHDKWLQGEQKRADDAEKADRESESFNKYFKDNINGIDSFDDHMNKKYIVDAGLPADATTVQLLKTYPKVYEAMRQEYKNHVQMYASDPSHSYTAPSGMKVLGAQMAQAYDSRGQQMFGQRW